MSEWEKYGRGPWKADQFLPHRAPDAAEAERLGLPPTLRPVPGARQSPVFDPAMIHHPRAMRAGEPRFRSQEHEERWYAARRQALGHVLAAVERTCWLDHLVLRGSVLLRAWYGEIAREPGDLDFVVIPYDRDVAEHRTVQMMEEIAGAAAEVSADGPVRIVAGGAVHSDIWTYTEAPGRRLVLPWEVEGLLRGTVQLDFVFGEGLPAAPEPTEIPREGGAPVILNAATPELSLAWKLRWLITDAHPQGKDLYDAWLLAVHSRPSHALLVRTLVAAHPEHASYPPTLEDIARLRADWREFRKDHPGVMGTDAHYADMLAKALAPVFAEAAEPNEYERRALRLARRIGQCRTVVAVHGMSGADHHLHKGVFLDAVVIRRELHDRRITVAEAAAEVLEIRERLRPSEPLLARYHSAPELLATDLEPLTAEGT